MQTKAEDIDEIQSRDPHNQMSVTEFINVPSFPLKAYEIVSDPKYTDIVRWNKEGDAFIITNKNEFSDKVLPKYFKHKNLSTFVRQLNIYGFKKTKCKNEDNCFAHPDFKRDDKRLLLNMKRKATKGKKAENKSTTSSDSPFITKEEVNVMFESVNQRIDEQNKRIDQLNQTNKEFKNSVLCLYNQLEKSRERVVQLEKVILDNQMNVSNTHQPIMNEKYAEQIKDKAISDKHIMMDNNLYNMFTSFVK